MGLQHLTQVREYVRALEEMIKIIIMLKTVITKLPAFDAQSLHKHF
jgi:hypothetical protein